MIEVNRVQHALNIEHSPPTLIFYLTQSDIMVCLKKFTAFTG